MTIDDGYYELSRSVNKIAFISGMKNSSASSNILM